MSKRSPQSPSSSPATANRAKELFREAAKARHKAHAPYSGFQIGAALLTRDGEVFAGCNVENASFGGTVCAERVAVFKAVSEGAKLPLREIVVVSPAVDPWPPCGFCRQVLAEFAGGELVIHLANGKGIVRSMTLAEIFPDSFNPKFLK